jgi:endonuclease YncB( thermonuclease family)
MKYRLFALAPLVSCGLLSAEAFSGKVVGVTDGDTVSVLRDGQAVTVRLEGIDSPEANQAFGTKAKQYVSESVFGKTITVETKGTDKYGRLLGEIRLSDGRNLNHELVERGLAWWYWRCSKDLQLAALEAQAKNARSGLWADAHQIAPWDFRRPSGHQSPGDTIETSEAVASVPRSSGVEKAGSSPAGTVQKNEKTVYITRTGRKFHSSGCSSLRSSAFPISRSEAISGGYGACLRCNP